MVNKCRSAFALVEAVVTAVTLAVLIALLLASASRKQGWQAGSIANLHEFASGTASYAADNTDQFFSFTWRPGVPTPSQYPDLHIAPSDSLDASAAQAVDILRRLTGRDSGPDMFPRISQWIPNPLYTHLVLADYLQSRLPLRMGISPGDKNRVLWSNDPIGFDRNAYNPNQPDGSDPTNYRWPYSSSYRYPTPFYCPDAVTATTGTIIPAAATNQYSLSGPTFLFGGRHIADVPFPSQKVQLFDTAQWQGAKTPVYFAFPFARVPMLLVDGSARVRVTSQSNAGFQPGNPRSTFPTSQTYSPASWDPPIPTGFSTAVTGYYFWTRGGIQGRDFDGQEIDTGNW